MKKLVMIAILGAAIAGLAKMMMAKKAAWSGMTEPEAREKLESRLPDKIPTEKRQEVADQIVSKMRDRGMIAESGPAEAAEAATSGNGSAVGETLDADSGEEAEAREQSS